MEKPTGQIRHSVYDYLQKVANYTLREEDKAFIHNAFSKHTENRIANLKDMARRFTLTQEKVSKYLKKARLSPKQFSKEIIVLEQVSKWLNSDAE